MPSRVGHWLTLSPAARRAVLGASLAAPVLWAVAVVAVVRPDAIRGRDDVPFAVKWLLYDESDLTALAIRGGNAYAGRLPGRADEPVETHWGQPQLFADQLAAPWPPFAPRYYLEYPVPALALFWLVVAVQPEARGMVWPPPVGDGRQFAVAMHVPRDDNERAVWATMRGAVLFYVLVMAAALAGTMLVVGKGYEPGGGLAGPVWLMALPGAVFFALNRFDALPAFATALSFYCLGRGRTGWAGVWLGVGVSLKLYPVLFVPVVLRYLGVRRASLVWLGGFAAAGLVALGGSLAAVGWDGMVGPVVVQLSRALEEGGWTFYGHLLPISLAKHSEWRLAILGGVTLAACAVRPRDLAGMLRRCAVVLIVFVSMSVFWSPQWLLWFLPLVVPLAGRRWFFVGSTVLLDLVTYACFPVLFWLLWNRFPLTAPSLVEVSIYLRAAVWAGLAGGLVWDEWASRRPDPAALFRRDADALREAFLKAAAGSGSPRGLTWVAADPAGEPVFAAENGTGRPVALLPLTVRFEPVPGSDMEDVPHARTPRPVTALFAFDGRAWQTTGRAVFNLSPEQVIEKGGFRVPLSPPRRGS